MGTKLEEDEAESGSSESTASDPDTEDLKEEDAHSKEENDKNITKKLIKNLSRLATKARAKPKTRVMKKLTVREPKVDLEEDLPEEEGI